MKKGLLIGNPVDKSVSHITHNEIFKILKIDAVYDKKVICIERLDEEVAHLKKMDYAYFAVTMPLKELIIPFLDERKDLIGSVNTIEVRDGKWIGYNFDGIGCLNAIENVEKVMGRRVLVLGAGGAAKSAIFEAKKRGAEVFVYNRTRDRAEKVAEQFDVQILLEIRTTFDIIIQATSIGMLTTELPIDMKWVTNKTLVMEMVYNPIHTLFTQESLKKGAKIVLGYEMFAELSFAQFELIFGNQVDKNIVLNTIKNFFIKN